LIALVLYLQKYIDHVIKYDHAYTSLE